jgi:hypothetical protein
MNTMLESHSRNTGALAGSYQIHSLAACECVDGNAGLDSTSSGHELTLDAVQVALDGEIHLHSTSQLQLHALMSSSPDHRLRLLQS